MRLWVDGALQYSSPPFERQLREVFAIQSEQVEHEEAALGPGVLEPLVGALRAKWQLGTHSKPQG